LASLTIATKQRHGATETLWRECPHQPGVVLEGIHDGFVVMLLQGRQTLAAQTSSRFMIGLIGDLPRQIFAFVIEHLLASCCTG
jgi:hypothetical protein